MQDASTPDENVTSPDETKAPLFSEGQKLTLIVLGSMFVVLGYCFLNAFVELTSIWEDPLYSHGWLVPVFAAALLWIRWDKKSIPAFNDVEPAARWYGVGLLTFGILMRGFAAEYGYGPIELVSFIPCLGGVCLIVGGWQFIRWVGPIVLFLVFMFPMLHKMEQALLVPLQKVATNSSEYVLQTFGYPVERKANTLDLGTVERDGVIVPVAMTVVEACSGLRMSTVFLAFCAAAALILECPLWQRILIFLSAVPIALVSNTIRIVATGMLMVALDGDVDVHVIHDWAGYGMMGIGMVLLFIEIKIFEKLLIEPEDTSHSVDPLGQGRTRTRSPSASR